MTEKESSGIINYYIFQPNKVLVAEVILGKSQCLVKEEKGKRQAAEGYSSALVSFTHTSTYICVCISVHMCAFISVHTQVYIPMHKCTYISVHTGTYVYIMRACMYMSYVHTFMYVHVECFVMNF
jgi:hypothetical protein